MENRELKALTIVDALKMVIDRLEDINVPVRFADEIARPMCEAVSMLKSCVDAMDRQKPEKPEKEGGADGEGDGVPD